MSNPQFEPESKLRLFLRRILNCDKNKKIDLKSATSFQYKKTFTNQLGESHEQLLDEAAYSLRAETKLRLREKPSERFLNLSHHHIAVTHAKELSVFHGPAEGGILGKFSDRSIGSKYFLF